ncbi:hypothetical protein PMAYCL1PPCAC_20037, partial [Pristionchus mayeri]
ERRGGERDRSIDVIELRRSPFPIVSLLFVATEMLLSILAAAPSKEVEQHLQKSDSTPQIIISCAIISRWCSIESGRGGGCCAAAI